MVSDVGVLGLGKAVPQRILTNKELEMMVDTTNEWILTRTGIKERRIADPNTAASDLGYQAAVNALEKAGVSASEIDYIITATITPDMLFPATACLIQAKLGAANAAAFDLSAGCSGFIYGLEVGNSLVKAGYNRVLVIGVDILSRITDYTDRSTCVLFGDGAGAAVLGPVAKGYGFVASEIGTDGTGGHYLHLPAGGSRKPASLQTVENKEHYLHMSGNEVFKFAVRIMSEATQRVLDKAAILSKEITWFVPHQANIRIINAAAERLGISAERIFVNVDRYGNTSAASVAIALEELVGSGRVNPGDLILLVGFGAGLTWGSLVFRWGGF